MLLALRLIAVVSAFSQAPFYSKLPLYARLYSSGDYSSLVRFAGRGMQFSYAAFLLGWIGLGLAGPRLFDAIGASTPFPPSQLWTLIALAFLVHRFGAMHIQLYNATNHVIMHIADGVSGGLFVVSVLALGPRFGVLAIPLSQLIAYVGFYNWYGAMHSYRSDPGRVLSLRTARCLTSAGVCAPVRRVGFRSLTMLDRLATSRLRLIYDLMPDRALSRRTEIVVGPRARWK